MELIGDNTTLSGIMKQIQQIPAASYNMANDKMIRKARFTKGKKKENDNKDIAI